MWPFQARGHLVVRVYLCSHKRLNIWFCQRDIYQGGDIFAVLVFLVGRTGLKKLTSNPLPWSSKTNFVEHL